MKNKRELNTVLYISISYGNYIGGAGGTDKVILSEQIELNKKGISLLHICPGTNHMEEKIKLWRVVIDGKKQGLFTSNHLLIYLSKLKKAGHIFAGCLIHHLLKIDISEFEKIYSRISCKKIWYIHDYYTICPTGGLIKNEEVYCGLGFPCDEKCMGCKEYSEKTLDRLEQICKLWRTSDEIEFVVPSRKAAAIWAEQYPEYEGKIKVIPHQKLYGSYTGNKEHIDADKPIKLAFIGYKRKLKGWDSWIKATQKVQEKGCNIELYQFGSTDEHYDYIKEIDVDFNENLDAMILALRKYKIDCGILWSNWPETYSFTFFEAMAANVFVLTNELSGNIAVKVNEYNNGYVANLDSESLEKILTDEERLRCLINDFKKLDACGPLTLDNNTEWLCSIENTAQNDVCIDRVKYLIPDVIDEMQFYLRYGMKKLLKV